MSGPTLLLLLNSGQDTTPDSNINLFIRGSANPAAVGSMPLYMSNNYEGGEISLYMSGPNPASGEHTLFTQGHIASSGEIPLYMIGHSGINENISLFIHGYSNASSGVDLSITGFGQASGDNTLYMIGHDSASGDISLFINGPHVWPKNKTLRLSIESDSILSGNLVGRYMKLFIENEAFGDNTKTMNLFIGPASQVAINKRLNLFLKQKGWTTIVDDLNLYVKATGPSGVSSSVDLFVEGQADTYMGLNASMNLFINRPNCVATMPLFVQSITGPASGTMTMYTFGVFQETDSINIAMPNTHQLFTRTSTLYTHGF